MHESYTSKLAIEYELSMDLIQTKRSVFTLFDVLGNTGGLLGISLSFFGYLSGVFHKNRSEDWIVSQLYEGHQISRRGNHPNMKLSRDASSVCKNC